MKILFVGGKTVGYEILKYLLKTDEVVGVYTNPSDLHPTWYPSLNPLIVDKDVPYFTKDINSSGDAIKKLEPDFIICAYYDKILKPEIIKLAKYDTINIHLGLINEYRGCYPTTFPIIDGKDHAGITIHQMTEEIDNGKVYCMERTEIEPTETGKSLYFKLTKLASKTFARNWHEIRVKKLLPNKIDVSNAIYHTREEFPSHKINDSLEPITKEEELDRLIRALTFAPFPKPYLIINGKKFEIHYE